MEEQIIVYWWNMGKKTLDYKGSYNGYLKKVGITVEVSSPPALNARSPLGWRFKISLSGCSATLDIDDTYRQGCIEAIRVYLLLLGDRATLYTPSRKYCINWVG